MTFPSSPIDDWNRKPDQSQILKLIRILVGFRQNGRFLVQPCKGTDIGAQSVLGFHQFYIAVLFQDLTGLGKNLGIIFHCFLDGILHIDLKGRANSCRQNTVDDRVFFESKEDVEVRSCPKESLIGTGKGNFGIHQVQLKVEQFILGNRTNLVAALPDLVECICIGQVGFGDVDLNLGIHKGEKFPCCLYGDVLFRLDEFFPGSFKLERFDLRFPVHAVVPVQFLLVSYADHVGGIHRGFIPDEIFHHANV